MVGVAAFTLILVQVCIWDLKDPTKPYAPTPGSRSTKLDEITSVAWNQQVPYVLAGASTTGYTVVWDLRGKREVVALAYGGGAGTLAGQVSATNGLAVGGRRGMSAIAWHPDNVRPTAFSVTVFSFCHSGYQTCYRIRRRFFSNHHGLGPS